jgi:hypothetical protein
MTSHFSSGAAGTRGARTCIFAFVAQLGVALLLALVGWYNWSIAEHFCEQARERRAKAHPIVRFLLYPRWLYGGRRCEWHLRFGGAVAMLIALFLIGLAVFALIRNP